MYAMNFITNMIAMLTLEKVIECFRYYNGCYSASDSKGKTKRLVPGTSYYVSNPLIYGNSKLSKTIAIFSLLPVVTCPNCANSGCWSTCYAIKAAMYPASFDLRMYNTYLAFNDLETLKNDIVKQLREESPMFVRIHESGDFFSQKYVNMWLEIIDMFPNIFFYGYTKTTEIFDFGKKRVNFKLNNSCLPDGSKNYGTDDELNAIIEKYPYLKLSVCGYREENPKALNPHCGNCKICMLGDQIPLFHIHGEKSAKKACKNMFAYLHIGKHALETVAALKAKTEKEKAKKAAKKAKKESA